MQISNAQMLTSLALAHACKESGLHLHHLLSQRKSQAMPVLLLLTETTAASAKAFCVQAAWFVELGGWEVLTWA